MASNKEPVAAVILAAGSGVRIGGEPKQFAVVAGKPLFRHSLDRYREIPAVSSIYLVVHPDHAGRYEEALGAGGSAPVLVVPGGATRRESVARAAGEVREEIVVLQNAASPLTGRGLVERCIALAGRHRAVQAYMRAWHTVFTLADGAMGDVLDRSRLGYTCDPTVYRRELLQEAVAVADRDGFRGESTLDIVRELGCDVHCVESDWTNLKVTTPNDLHLARLLLEAAGSEKD